MMQHSLFRGLPLAVCLLLPWLAVTATAAEQASADTKSVRIVRATGVPVIDGHIDPDEWAGATLIEDLHQIQPNEFAKPSQRTQIYLLYDKDALYVAARLWDTRPVTARILRQGELLAGDDHFGVILNPENDRRSGYMFVVGPNGVRVNGIYQNVTQTQFDWDGIFDATGSQDKDGWVAEMAIPYKTISFDPQGDTWGINFFRVIAGVNERIGWVSRNRAQDPSIVGTVQGFSGLERGLGLDVVPSVSVTSRREFDPAASETDTHPSLDIFYKITPTLNGALTFNTDFSATEVDDRQVNLTRFGLFFPEKRDFFLTDLDIFEFGHIGPQNTGFAGVNTATTRASRENGRPFFSRRIGLAPTGAPIDLDYGGKLTGRVGRWSIGALGIQQEAYGTVESADLFVGRLSANVFDESTIGIIATNGNPRSNLNNSLIGADFLYQNSRLPGGSVIQAEAWVQGTQTTGLEGDDTAFGLGLRVPNNTGWRGAIALKELGTNFNPGLGFLNQAGITDYTAEFGYTYRPAGKPVRWLFGGLDARRVDLVSGELQTQTFTWRALETSNHAGDILYVHLVRNREVLFEPFEISPGVVLPVGDYTFDEHVVTIDPGEQRRISGRLTYRGGDFYDGDHMNLIGELTFRPGKHFRTTLTYDYNDVNLPEGDFIVRLTSMRLDIVFSSRLSWVNLIQYDNVSGVVGINSRLHYIPEDGREAYLVLNHIDSGRLPVDVCGPDGQGELHLSLLTR
jgi:Domain of unknown function (DUF5916)/Carbohydrate family 9 binding domain-like